MGKNMEWKREHWLSEPHDHPAHPEIYLLITYSCSKGACHSCLIFWPRSPQGLPWWFSGKEHTCQCRRGRFDSWVRKIPWRRKWQPTPGFLPGESHGQRGTWQAIVHQGAKESDMTERLNNKKLCSLSNDSQGTNSAYVQVFLILLNNGLKVKE